MIFLFQFSWRENYFQGPENSKYTKKQPNIHRHHKGYTVWGQHRVYEVIIQKFSINFCGKDLAVQIPYSSELVSY